MATPTKKKNKHRAVMFRYAFISACIILFAGCIAYQVFKTTVIDSHRWNSKANTELSRQVDIKPERGDILASDGSVLATNLRYYTVRIDFGSEKFMLKRYLQAIDSLGLPDSLQRYFPRKGGRTEWYERLRRPLSADKKPRSWLLLRNVSYADYERLRTFPFFNIKNPYRNGLTLEDRMRRSNPYGDMARRSIGVVYEDSASGEIHGYSGLEKALDSLLYGVPGKYKRIPLTRGIVDWTDTAAVRGYDILTTIDINMQDIVENELNDMLETTQADWGVAVLMDVSTGDIKAISNLDRNPRGPGYVEGMNRAVLGFEPGSVVKTLSMMIAIDDGLVRSLDEVIPTGHSFAYAGGRPITDSHYTASMPVREVLEQSSNIAMARIITRHYDRHPEAWRERVGQLGFFEKLNCGIAGERGAYYPKVSVAAGGRVTLSRMAYGYATEIPPLHTLSIYNAIANDGRYVRPRLIKGLKSATVDSTLAVSYVRPRACSEKTAEIMRGLLKRVVWGDRGTARMLRDERVSIAGKTGTCWMVDPNTRQYIHGAKRLAFCGFFPADAPRYSAIVLIARPRKNFFGAASTSGTVLKNVALKMYSRGMLGNSSDYRADATSGSEPLTLYASRRTSLPDRIGRELGVKKVRQMREPDKMARHATAAVDSGVPDVCGMGLREAVVVMEARGYNVKFTGAGYVAAQSPHPGTKFREGASVTLHLHE